MTTFQHTREHTEQKVMVQLLSEIENNPTLTQRHLASQLGIALGLMNQYLKTCLAKGWIRVSQVSPKRLSYFLTPEGFKEKSLMVGGYLSRSFTFYKEAKLQCSTAFEACLVAGDQTLGLFGKSELSEIVELLATQTSLSVKVLENGDLLDQFDKIIITDVLNPQGAYDHLKTKLSQERLITLPLLHISKASF